MIIKDWNYIKDLMGEKKYLTKAELDRIDKKVKRVQREKKLKRILNI